MRMHRDTHRPAHICMHMLTRTRARIYTHVVVLRGFWMEGGAVGASVNLLAKRRVAKVRRRKNLNDPRVSPSRQKLNAAADASLARVGRGAGGR